MQPSSKAAGHLRTAISEALARWSPQGELAFLPSHLLSHYSHELAFALPRPDLPTMDLPVQAWVARPPVEGGEQAVRRHYLVAVGVELDASAEWFPKLLGTASRLRSHLSAEEQADILLLVVAEPGSRETGRTAILERNESFAQVLVWRPGEDDLSWPSAAREFVHRLRLGPLNTPTAAGGGDLSPIDSIFQEADVPDEVRSKWQAILMEGGAKPKHTERAKRLLAVMDEHAGGAGVS